MTQEEKIKHFFDVAMDDARKKNALLVDEYKKELEKKLKEEYEEVLLAKDKKERLEELADMLEVIRTLALLEDEDIQSVINIMDKKREKRGGFTKKLFLEKTIK